MLKIQRWLPLVALLAFAACRDATAPASVAARAGAVALADDEQAPGDSALSPSVHIVRQSPGAPALEAYRISFWVRRGKASTQTLNYLPAPGQRAGDPFVRFDIPKDGLLSDGGGDALDKHDSVLVTLVVDTLHFDFHFEPSGVLFSQRAPAILQVCYEHANPDLNDDGQIDRTDDALQQQLAVWYHLGTSRGPRQAPAPNVHRPPTPWRKLTSNHDAAQPCVAAQLFHFSQYAVSW